MTKIAWTNETWNPIVGCSKVSEGCQNCYAEKMACRLAAMGQETYQEIVTKRSWKGKTLFVESQLDKPFQWKKGRMIFVCSMGDLFHESVPFEWVDRVIDVIRWTKQHTYQVLTKRPERMCEYFTKHVPEKYMLINGSTLDNLWIGVTAENQDQANKRIPTLLQIPAAKRYVSIEPMLGPVDLTKIDWLTNHINHFILNSLEGYLFDKSDIHKLDWVICGSESGTKRRPMDFDWAVDLRDQCVKASVPFFFKQRYIGNKKMSLPPIDCRIWNQIPDR